MAIFYFKSNANLLELVFCEQLHDICRCCLCKKHEISFLFVWVGKWYVINCVDWIWFFTELEVEEIPKRLFAELVLRNVVCVFQTSTSFCRFELCWLLLFSFLLKKFAVNWTPCSQMLFLSAIRFPSWFCLVYLDLRKPHDAEFVYKLWKSLGKLFDFREYFCAIYSGSGEADTTASSFTTSGEEPLETTTSEMTGLLLIKINFSFCQGQWLPRCQQRRRFENLSGVSRNKVF